MHKIKIDKAYEQAKAIIKLEGFKLTSEDEKIIKAVITGKLKREKFIGSLQKQR
ncbi:hypothetical protein [Oceanobacillus massiliensis]|uniref:hypothetical protein n=1 Tax=Oceanobacillus massiliensis TaxID=1465765 RepID=UPI003015F90B